MHKCCNWSYLVHPSLWANQVPPVPSKFDRSYKSPEPLLTRMEVETARGWNWVPNKGRRRRSRRCGQRWGRRGRQIPSAGPKNKSCGVERGRYYHASLSLTSLARQGSPEERVCLPRRNFGEEIGCRVWRLVSLENWGESQRNERTREKKTKLSKLRKINMY